MPENGTGRWLARPRTLWTGLGVSLLVHAAVAGLVVLIWTLIPVPPMAPITITSLPDAPNREQMGEDPRGHRAVDAVTPEPVGSAHGRNEAGNTP